VLQMSCLLEADMGPRRLPSVTWPFCSKAGAESLVLLRFWQINALHLKKIPSVKFVLPIEKRRKIHSFCSKEKRGPFPQMCAYFCTEAECLRTVLSLSHLQSSLETKGLQSPVAIKLCSSLMSAQGTLGIWTETTNPAL
jgi:hypothetical protein